MHSIPCCFGTTLSSINTWLLSYGGLFCKPYNSIFWIAAICKNDRLQLLEFFMKAFRMIPFDLDALNLIINYSEEQVYNTKSGMHGIFIFMSGKRKICIERNSMDLLFCNLDFWILRFEVWIWFEKSGLRNLVREKWLTRKKNGFIP